MSGCGSSSIPFAPRQPVLGVRDIVCIASGKGGVGKSTLTVNLAAALAARNLTVGVLDADLYGPSISLLLGTDEGVEAMAEGKAKPKFSHGIHSLSVGNLLVPESGLVWKGPLIAQAIEQMLYDVAWPELDVLLIDMPPGTGDIPITLLERVPVSGAVVVSTPQRLAAIDAERAISLFHEYDVPVFGVVENMDGYVCPCCGKIERLFAGGIVAPMAKKRHVAYFGSVPLDPTANAAADAGKPFFLQNPDGPSARAIAEVSGKLMASLAREHETSKIAENV
ncbi:MAG: Mrp/NBP35 family ATP-binding protein [Alphaproteobacteria bacterium]|nr:Mrp/NBP35 family ATP-binding protein [Alphaproteobacteria bacterium]